MSGAESDLSPAVSAPAATPAAPSMGGGGGLAGAARGLQRSAGNAAMARLLQRDDSSGGVATPPPATVAPGDQSSAGGPAKIGLPDFKKLVAEKDTSGIRRVDDFTPAAPADRIAMIHILLEDTWWVGGSDREAIVRLWEAWGTAGILEAYSQNEALWDKAVAAEVNLGALKALQPYREKFGDDVKAVAAIYQGKNAEAVKAERARLNLGHVDDVFGAGGAPPVAGKEIIEVQQLAREVQRADDLLASLYHVPVGTMEVAEAPKAPGTPSGDQSAAGGTPAGVPPAGTPAGNDSGGGVPVGGAPVQGPFIVDVLFSVDHPPANGAPAKGREKEFRTYDSVAEQFRKVTAARAVIGSRSPALFAASSGKPGEAGRIAEMSPHDAMIQLGRALNNTSEAIERAGPMIADGRIDWRDFTPIHQQLWDGMPARSGLAWNSKLAKSVSKDVIGDYKTTEFWRQIGLTSLAAAAFVFAEIATGGMAAFLWAATAAASGTQAAISVQKYSALATAAQTATSKDTQLVSTEQVSDAQAAAVLDTAFAFLDVLMAAKGVVGGVNAAAAASRVAAREGLAGIATLAPARAQEVLRTAIRELGPRETIRRTAGMSVDDLVKLAGGEATQEAKALRSAAEEAAVVRPRGAGLDSLPAYVATPAGRKLAAAAHSRVWERWAELGTPQARLNAMVDLLNSELEHIGAPKLRSILNDALLLDGELDSAQWGVSLRSSLLAGEAPTEAQFASLWGLVSHEVEHGTQWFAVAQVRASTSGLNAGEIAAELGIPERVADAAIEVQNGTRRGLKLVPGTAEWNAADTFRRSLIGSGGAARNATFKELESTLGELKAARAECEKLAETDPARAAALDRWERARTAHDAAELKYVQLPEEAAAYSAGGSAAASMKERFALVHEWEQAARAEREAVAAMKRIDAQMAELAHAGKDVPYALKVDFYTAAKNADEALAELADAVDNLGKAEHGVAP